MISIEIWGTVCHLRWLFERVLFMKVTRLVILFEDIPIILIVLSLSMSIVKFLLKTLRWLNLFYNYAVVQGRHAVVLLGLFVQIIGIYLKSIRLKKVILGHPSLIDSCFCFVRSIWKLIIFHRWVRPLNAGYHTALMLLQLLKRLLVYNSTCILISILSCCSRQVNLLLWVIDFDFFINCVAGGRNSSPDGDQLFHKILDKSLLFWNPFFNELNNLWRQALLHRWNGLAIIIIQILQGMVDRLNLDLVQLRDNRFTLYQALLSHPVHIMSCHEISQYSQE